VSRLGRQFAEAVAAKDFDRVAGLLDPEIDFRGITPNRFWEASDPVSVISDVLERWFEESDHIEELVAVDTARIADRERLSYRIRGHNPDGPFVVEQQAYFTERDGRIDWMRVLCSGFRPDVRAGT
jgi:hypothetical protein